MNKKQKVSNRLRAFHYYPQCKCKLANGNSIVLNGGSMAKIGDSKYSSEGSLLPFLMLLWHEYTPQKNNKEVIESSVILELTDEKNHALGQFEYNFCSIECIRNWFNSKLNKLEMKAKARGLTKLKTKNIQKIKNPKRKTKEHKNDPTIQAFIDIGSEMSKEDIGKLKEHYGIK
jgi:hypothetical protein